jgi:hypothetical protein
VFEEPRGQSSADCGGGLGLVEDGLLLADFEGRFDGLQELDGEAVALVDVGDVAVEAGLDVFIG